MPQQKSIVILKKFYIQYYNVGAIPHRHVH